MYCNATKQVSLTQSPGNGSTTSQRMQVPKQRPKSGCLFGGPVLQKRLHKRVYEERAYFGGKGTYKGLPISPLSAFCHPSSYREDGASCGSMLPVRSLPGQAKKIPRGPALSHLLQQMTHCVGCLNIFDFRKPFTPLDWFPQGNQGLKDKVVVSLQVIFIYLANWYNNWRTNKWKWLFWYKHPFLSIGGKSDLSFQPKGSSGF